LNKATSTLSKSTFDIATKRIAKIKATAEYELLVSKDKINLQKKYIY
jgi:hypothetical protein